MPLDDTQVELILQAAQTVAIGINQRNIIVLADEVFRQRAATWPAPRIIIFICSDPLVPTFD
ncbi:Uncharacterised protein [Klebsiella pneumoniae]|uniref:Uncharacterized protein n=1 Tax=Klebsiella pneumoniae TaxID=573 RepID=A0A2X3CPR7_KLEPN|nr:Uncharacterised protein [Klebsiella pneumoniae]